MNRFSLIAIILVCALLLMGTWQAPSPSVSQAADRIPDQIRVALFIDIGKFYRGTVSSVTLSPAPRAPLATKAVPAPPVPAIKSLTVGERAVGKIIPWMTVSGDVPQLFAPDRFIVALQETDKYAVAVNLYNKMGASESDKAHMDLVYRKGKPLYRVLAGMYPSKEAAQSARSRLLASSKLKGLIQSEQVYVIGNKRLEVGVDSKESDAKNRVASLRQQGFHPQLNVTADTYGKKTYIVTLGEATDDVDLELLRAQVSIVSPVVAASLKPFSLTSKSYFHMKEAVIPSGSNGSPSTLFLFNPNGQRVHVGAGAEGIRVKERENRVYRGDFEVTQHNKVLTLINIIPFQSYLCSVVGAEMGASFPDEALKAQAIIARTYASAQGMKYAIANVSDTTYDQAYKGTGTESVAVNSAVIGTENMLLMYQDELVSAVYFSNAGGRTAEPSEVWGGSRPYFKSVASPDQVAANGLPSWYRVSLASGQIGYIHEDFVQFTGAKNALGFRQMMVKGKNVNLRPMPSASSSPENAPVAVVSDGTLLTMMEKTMQSNSFQWIEGPFSGSQMLERINAKAAKKINGPLQTLQVTERGPSARATEISANGTPITVSSPDGYRTLMGGLRSTLFDIDEMGSYTVLGASGKMSLYPQSKQPLYVVRGSAGTVEVAKPLQSDTFVILDGQLQPRVASKQVAFRFIGRGYGHGLGLSQWGAKGLAEKGMTYQQILKYYYAGVSVTTEP